MADNNVQSTEEGGEPQQQDVQPQEEDLDVQLYEPTEEELKAGKKEELEAWKTHTLEYKQKALNKYYSSYTDHFVQGSYVDAMDTELKWKVAQIREVKEDTKQMYLHYDGWIAKWDIWTRARNRVHAFKFNTPAYTGQKDVALRNDLDFTVEGLREERAVLEALIATNLDGLNAWEVTQYFRGKLFIYVDFLFGGNEYHPAEIDEVIDFLKCVLLCIVVYLRKLTSWEKEYTEMQTEKHLWLVCPQHALLCSFPELAEMLRKFFGSCHRAIRFYMCFDKNQELPADGKKESLIVKDMLSEDFESVRTDPDEYMVLEGKSRVFEDKINFGQLLNFVQYFHEIGGFTALTDAISMGCERKTKQLIVPLPIISAFLMALKRLRVVLEPVFAKNLVEKGRTTLIGSLTSMEDKDIKNVEKEDISKLFTSLNLFLNIGMSSEDAAREFETTQLALSLRFLVSSNLEKRLKGLNDIRNMIDQVLKSAKKAHKKGELNPDNKWLGPLDEEEENTKVSMMQNRGGMGWNQMQKKKIEPSEFMTTGAFVRWLMDKKVLEVVLGENTHTEIVKRSAPILKFLIKYGAGCFDGACVAILWKCQEGKHEEMVRIVYSLIQEISPVLTMDLINEIFNRIREIPLDTYDEKFLAFLQDLTKKALEQQFIQKIHELKKEDDKFNQAYGKAIQELSYTQTMEEIQVVKDLKGHLEKDEGDCADMYGLPIFWALCCDETGAVSRDLQDQALASMKALIKENFRKMVRMPFLIKALKNINQGKSPVASIALIKIIIDGYNNDAKRWYNNDDEEIQEEDPTDLAFNLQKQLNIIDFLINNCAQYNEEVKQKMQVMYQKSQPIPEKIEDFCFFGTHKHSDAILNILELIEFLVLVSNNKVEIGIENIEKLWFMFVKQPNFECDKNLFLTWMSKARFREDKYQNKKWELTIFQSAEKDHLFLKILCDPSQTGEFSVPMAKAFHKYFIEINAQRKSLKLYSTQLQVNDFQGLLGIDALWNFSMNSASQKARDTVAELIVDVHLNLSRNENDFNPQQRQEIAIQFIDKCMEADTSAMKGVIHLLGLFLDRYEGIRPLKPMHWAASRQNYNCNVKVMNRLEGAEPGLFQVVPVSYFQTIGFLRKKIATAFNLELNQFHLYIRQQPIDPDEDDDYVKEYSQYLQMCQIRTNKFYDPSNHPKYLISSNQGYFNTIFGMLNAGKPELLVPVWDLIQRLPVNTLILKNVKDLPDVKAAKESGDAEQLAAAWTAMFDPSSIYQLLYCLRIVKDNFLPETDDDEMKEENEKTIWKDQFMQLGGFQHLMHVFCKLNAPMQSMLSIQCVEDILQMILDFDEDSELLGQIDHSLQKDLLLRTLQFVEQICTFSLNQEINRGSSWEAIESKAKEAAQKAKITRTRQTWGKEDKSKEEEEEGGDQEQKKLLPEFTRQAELINGLFQFLTSLTSQNHLLIKELVNYPNLEQMLVQGCIKSENFKLRQMICSHVKDFVSLNRSSEAQQDEIRQALFQKVLAIQLFGVLPLTSEPALEQRISTFYTSLRDSLELVEDKDFESMKDQVVELIQILVQSIKTREIRETSSESNDALLTGQMQVLARLLAPLPEMKIAIGQDLVPYLIHDCLFETPKAMKRDTKGAPKCKGQKSRTAAFQLLAVLTRDVPESLDYVFDYIKKFNMNPSWRTNKETDWKLSFAVDEKSSTGYVGLKNLGCICYMNSLNQQLFMIPGFRNDILSISDPNNDKNEDADNMFLQWQTLFAGLLLSEKMYVSPKAYCHSFKDWEGQPVNVIEQMDVEEYLNMFLDRLESAIKGTPQEKTINYHFGGELANEIVGKTCPHKYERKEPMLSIGVTVKNKKSVHEGMQAFILGDMLEADNQYHCEKCDKKVDALKRVCIKKLPRYLIMTLKRFEFDFDTMQRQKVNDYFEFPVDLDLSNYTQEYLSKKEAYDKSKAEKLAKAEGGSEEEILADLKQEELKFQKEYYQYELVGATIHTGTADSGHYYSYIREQQDQPSEKWYEFDDTCVREFDPAEIPDECFGGEETSYGGWNTSKKFMKFRNAYILMYRRKLRDDVHYSDDEEEEAKNEGPQLGRNELDLTQCTNPLLSNISSDNHFYWQTRFLFGEEYNTFVKDILDGWTTSFCIPAQFPFRNADWHLLEPRFRANETTAIQTSFVKDCSDKKRDMSIFPQERMQQTMIQVFKFAAQFYLTIQIRAQGKRNFPTLNRYLKSYINANVECAGWLIKEFTNFEILKEMLLESDPGSFKYMRRIVSGMLYCAMVKLYQNEKDELLVEGNQTVLGNFINFLLNKLPPIYQTYSKNISQILSLLSGFARQGAQARQFLHRAGGWLSFANLFFNNSSPGFDKWCEKDETPVRVTEEPEMGLGITEDPTVEKRGWAAYRQRQLQTDDPQLKYCVETMGYLLASLTATKDNPFAMEDSGYTLQTNLEKLLFQPATKFTAKIFFAAKKPRAFLPIIRGYMAAAYNSEKVANYLFSVIEYGLTNSDQDYTPQFYSLFEALLGCTDASWHAEDAPKWLQTFVEEIVAQNERYFLWTEQTIEWILKVTSQIEYVRKWFESNTEAWQNIYQWVLTNKDPPSGFGTRSRLQLSKGNSYNHLNSMQSKSSNKLYNAAAQVYRVERLKELISPPEEPVDRSADLDMFKMDMHDFKWEKDTFVEWQESPGNMVRRRVDQTLDEMIQFHGEDEPNPVWKLTCGNRIMPDGTLNAQPRTKRIQEIYAEMAERKKNEVAYTHHSNQMKDDDDEEEEEDETDNYIGQNHFYQHEPQDDSEEHDLEAKPV